MTVPIQWPGETVLCIASGPSLNEADVLPCRGKMRCIAVNDCWKMAPWAEVLYACDFKWWAHYQGVPEFSGQKWSIDAKAAKQFPDIRRVIGKNEKGLSLSQSEIHTGRNSGYQALNLAVLFGAKRIILTGYDIQRTGGRTHWFGDHPRGLNNTVNYRAFVETFNTIPKSIAGKEIEIINCTRETALRCFPRMTMEEAIERYCPRVDSPGGISEIRQGIPESEISHEAVANG